MHMYNIYPDTRQHLKKVEKHSIATLKISLPFEQVVAQTKPTCHRLQIFSIGPVSGIRVPGPPLN